MPNYLLAYHGGGMAQDEATKKQRWDEATRWSLPKAETLRLIIPGLFGYRMPELYGEPVESANGSNYWGAMGQSPVTLRHSGGGELKAVKRSGVVQLPELHELHLAPVAFVVAAKDHRGHQVVHAVPNHAFGPPLRPPRWRRSCARRSARRRCRG